MQGIGLELPSESLGIAHLVLAGGLAGLAMIRPPLRIRRLVLGLGIGLTLLLPLVWVGPLRSGGPERLRFMLGFYQTFALGLAVPFGIGALAVFLLDRRSPSPRPAVAAGLTLAAYLLGLLASYPISFNYALLYPLLR